MSICVEGRAENPLPMLHGAHTKQNSRNQICDYNDGRRRVRAVSSCKFREQGIQPPSRRKQVDDPILARIAP